MVDEVVLKRAAYTAWTMYRSKHPDADSQDDRRCLLERHVQRRWEERRSDSDELASFGIAYLDRLPDEEC